jgi:hypothetical protein
MIFRLAIIASLCLGGCAPIPPAPTALVDVMARPAERALLAGLRAYDDAQYPEAETQLNQALQAGLAAPKDRAAAYKYLAFIFCTSNRMVECEGAFRSARLADPEFTLSKSESGHPHWGEIYKRVRP